MAETKYTIGKPAPNDITGSTVRFPMSPSSHGSTEFLNEVVTLEGAKLVWDSGTDYLVMQTRPSESLQDVADQAKLVVAKVNEWVARQTAKFDQEDEARRKAAEEATARANELRRQLHSLNLD